MPVALYRLPVLAGTDRELSRQDKVSLNFFTKRIRCAKINTNQKHIGGVVYGYQQPSETIGEIL